MAVPKRIKVGGAYYKGAKCAVSSAAASYTTVIVNTSNAAINGISITPDEYGADDTMEVRHFNDTAGTGTCLAIIAENMYNVGKSATIMLDFPAAEQILSGESIKFTYINAASVAMNVYLLSEYLGIRKTA